MSRLPRFFISAGQVSGGSIIVAGEDVHHIAMVMRMRAGDKLMLCDGKGTEYTVKIVDVGRSDVKTEIVSRSEKELPNLRITLGQGLPKADKMDFIVQKATELGVSSIVPIVTARTIVKIKDEGKRIVRWQKIAREAAMQSNRIDIPQIGGIRKFSDFIENLDSGSRQLLLMPWEEGTEPIKNILRQKPEAQDIVILIGPEGGYSSAEATAARDKGFRLVSLGPNILRTETAAMAVLSMICYEFL
ncbi:MAG TPA: 16S rRNA (uracil(1498)-N(3))-methyltransferase [Nitrospirota bacterium]|nr:16S rRNA (uracil(1498)-N(3))-methyltransferase [Nitrospirota bacterium]